MNHQNEQAPKTLAEVRDEIDRNIDNFRREYDRLNLLRLDLITLFGDDETAHKVSEAMQKIEESRRALEELLRSTSPNQ